MASFRASSTGFSVLALAVNMTKYLTFIKTQRIRNILRNWNIQITDFQRFNIAKQGTLR